MQQPKREFEIKLRALKGNYNAPDVRRLAIILKRLLRSYGFVCTGAKAIEAEPPATPQDKP